MQARRYRLLFVLALLCTWWLALPATLHAQRQMETLGRGVVAVRSSSTQAYVGWRLLGDEPTDIGFHVYRSVAGAAPVRITSTPITTSTNYLDTPGSTALASAIAYSVTPVVNGVEQARSAAYTLPAGSTAPSTNNRTLPSLVLPLATAYPNPAAPATPYDVKFCWVGDFDGDGEYDFLVDRVPTASSLNQYLEAYRRDGTFLWRMDMGPNSTAQSNAYEPGSSVISIGDTDNVTVYDLDGDGLAEVAVRTANGVTVTNAAGQTVASVTAGDNTTQFVSVIDGLSGAELGRVTLPNPWAQHGTLTSKCAIAYLDGLRPSVIFYGYNRADSGAFYRVFSAFDYRGGVLSQRWSTPQTFDGAEGHQIRIADVDNDGKDEIVDIGHVIDDDGTQLFNIPELSHGDRFHVADINPDRPGLENYIIQQNNPSFLATAYYDAGTGQMLKKWYATDVVDVGRGIALDLNSTHKGYEMYSTQAGIFNAKGEQIYANNVWAPEGLWWDADLLREFIDGPNNGATSPVINKFSQAGGSTARLWDLYSSGVHQAYGGRPAFWGDILGDWREEVVLVNSAYTALRIFTTHNVATNRLYTLMHNPAYRTQATTKGYVQGSNVDYYLGVDMTVPPPPPMVRATLAWSPGAGASAWDTASTAAWKNTSSGASATYAAGDSVRFDLSSSNASPVALSGVLQPGDVTVYSPFDYTFDGSSGSLAGSMKLVKAGKGSLRVTGSHAFTGATTVWDGALRVDGALTASAVTVWGGTWGGALAKGLAGGRLAGSGTISQPVSLQYRGALTPGPGMNSAGTLTLGAGLTAVDGAVLAFDLSTDPSGTTLANDRLAITGNLALSGTVALVINPLSGQLAPGAYTLATYTGSLTGSASNLSVIVPEGTPYNLSLGSGALTLTIPVTRPAAAVTWTGSATGAWDLANTANWRLSGSPDVFVSGDSVTFDDTGASRPSITLDVAAPVGGATFTGATNYTLSGTGSIAGSGGLTKSGAGTVTLNTTNTFTGPVSVTGGVLAVDNLADGGEPSSIGASSSAASNFVLNGGTLRLVGSQTNTNRALTLGASGGAIDNTATFQISGGITGAGALTKTGTGSLILANANTYSGGTILQAGTLVLASDAANTNGLGSGGVTLQGGTLRMYDNNESYNTSSWPITVPAGATARFEVDGRSTLAGSLGGSGTLNYYTTFVRTDITGNWSAFAGTLNVITGSGGDLRFSNSNGMGNAALNLAANTATYSILNSTHTFAIGALSGSGGLSGNTNANRTVTWQIGAKNLDTTFAGPITNSTAPAALTKVGTGVLTLTGASTYSGNTTVTAGRLVLSGGSLSGSAVTVQSGAGFGGNGSVTGNVTFNAGSVLLANPAAPLAITGNITFGGNVTVSPVPGAVLSAGTYTLYTYTGTRTGSPVYTWNGPGYSATFDNSVAGQVSYTLAPSILPPTNLTALPGNASAQLSWTASASASTTSYTVKRATVSGGPYTNLATGVAGTAYSDTGLTNGITYYYVVAAVGADAATADSTQASVSVGPAIPRAFLRLDETSGLVASDSSGNGWNGSLVNTPAWSAGRINNSLSLTAASSQHATIPSGLVSGLNDFSFSAWVKVASFASWARVFDFGTGTTNYMFLTTQYSGSAGMMRFGIRTPAIAEQSVSASTALPLNTWAHVVVTLSDTTCRLYLNGAEVGSGTITLKPSGLGATTQNYLGRSQWPDPYLNGSLDEVQLFARALTASEISALATPPVAPAGLAATPGDAEIALSWSAVSGADSYSVKRAASASGPYALVASGLTTTSYTNTGLTNGTTYHYTVTASRSVAESARSASVSATPAVLLSEVESWRVTHFGSPSATGNAADDADPDADGLANLLEYALGADPMSASPALVTVTAPSATLVLNFQRIADPALTYTVQGSSDLSAWIDVWTSTGEQNTAGPVSVPDTEPVSSATRRFLRLRVSH